VDCRNNLGEGYHNDDDNEKENAPLMPTTRTIILPFLLPFRHSGIPAIHRSGVPEDSHIFHSTNKVSLDGLRLCNILKMFCGLIFALM
jgi:hypothetical protein